jgi:uncharacterized membrane protein
MKATRLEAFSDGVIAIIITIMVLELKAPHDPTPAGLMKVLPTLLSYILSFTIVAIYWLNHHHLVHLAHKVDSMMLWANVNLLFWMSLIPWVTAYLGDSHATPLAVGLYGSVAVACSASFYLLRSSIARHHRADGKLCALHRRMGRKNLLAVGIYLSAIPLSWACVPLALGLIALPAIMYFLPDRQVEQLHQAA